MAERLFEVGTGFSDRKVNYLSGVGAPSGALVDAAPIGSYWTDIDSGSTYKKRSQGSGEDKWISLVDKEYLDTFINGVSWREPVIAANFALTALQDVLDDLNADDQFDTVTVVAGDRILLGGLTEDPNVYIVGGVTGAWTLTPDGNAATKGDTLYTQGGEHAGVRYTFNGTAWIYTDKTTLDELSAIRDFIGKDLVGAETPNYSSSTQVGATDNLETAISKLDTAIGDDITAPAARTVGAVVGNATIHANIAALDTAIGVNPSNDSNHINPAQAVNANLQSLDTFIGARPENGSYILNANTVAQNLAALDSAVANTIVRSTKSGITSVDTVDSVLVDLVQGVEWSVLVVDAANPSTKAVFKIMAVHDGTVTADATSTDSNQYSRIEVGGVISGLNFIVDVDGSGIAQTMRLRITSAVAVNVQVARIKL